LVVPATDPKKISKALGTNADIVCIDLEDSVPSDQKQSAREQVISHLRDRSHEHPKIQLRINELCGAVGFQDLVETCGAISEHIDSYVIPKVCDAADLVYADRIIRDVSNMVGTCDSIGVVALIETAQGLTNVNAIARATPRLQSLVFGSGDFAASLGAPQKAIGGFDEYDESYRGHRWSFAMQSIIVAARANGLSAIDGPYARFTDLCGLRETALCARSLGFDGKWCIHPAQVDPANLHFLPTQTEVEEAHRILNLYEASVAQGVGAISMEGTMIDQATVQRCTVIISRHNQFSLKTDAPSTHGEALACSTS